MLSVLLAHLKQVLWLWLLKRMIPSVFVLITKSWIVLQLGIHILSLVYTIFSIVFVVQDISLPLILRVLFGRLLSLIRKVWRRGLFEYVKMPFGLTNAASEIQRLTDMIVNFEFTSTSDDCVFRYFDDLILVFKDFQSHVGLLRKFLKSANSVKANWSIWVTLLMKKVYKLTQVSLILLGIFQLLSPQNLYEGLLECVHIIDVLLMVFLQLLHLSPLSLVREKVEIL